MEYKSRVSEEVYNIAMANLNKEIAKIDTPEEWLDISKRLTIAILRIVGMQIPVANLLTNILKEAFVNKSEILAIINTLTGGNDVT